MKKTLLTLLLSVLTITAVTGCSDKTDTSQIESSNEQLTDSRDISEVTDDNSENESAVVTGTFDWDTAMSQTTLEGRKVPMPFSVNDLGETYELRVLVNAFFGGSGCTASLWNMAYEDSETGEITEKSLGNVSFDYVSTDEYTDDCKISYFESDELNIQGIQEGVSMELVYDAWGEPHESDDVAVYYFNKEQDKVISIYIDDENKIQLMNVDFEFEKDEN